MSDSQEKNLYKHYEKKVEWTDAQVDRGLEKKRQTEAADAERTQYMTEIINVYDQFDPNGELFQECRKLVAKYPNQEVPDDACVATGFNQLLVKTITEEMKRRKKQSH